MNHSDKEGLNDFYYDKTSGTHGNISHHYHDSHEIYFLAEGRCNYLIDGTVYEIQTGDVVFIPEGTIHKTNYPDKKHSRRLINCSSVFLPPSVTEQLDLLCGVYRDPHLAAEAKRIFSRIEEEYAIADIHSRDAIKCYTGELLLLLFRSKNKLDKERGAQSVAQRAVRYVGENYRSEIKLTDLARAYSVSAEHLSRSFKKEIGLGFNEYLTLLRLKRAEYMLKNEPGKSVSEIAFLCGFNDSNYFSDKFKRAYGIPPSRLSKIKRAK